MSLNLVVGCWHCIGEAANPAGTGSWICHQLVNRQGPHVAKGDTDTEAEEGRRGGCEGVTWALSFPLPPENPVSSLGRFFGDSAQIVPFFCLASLGHDDRRSVGRSALVCGLWAARFLAAVELSANGAKIPRCQMPSRHRSCVPCPPTCSFSLARHGTHHWAASSTYLLGWGRDDKKKGRKG